jgi:hypothetical protein
MSFMEADGFVAGEMYLWSVLISGRIAFRHPIWSRRGPMSAETQTETMPPTFTDAEVKKQLVNDSLGTIDTADSTGSDETKETGDAKKGNAKTRED